MKIRFILASLLLPLGAQAALPPAYLSVPDFQQCLSQKQNGTFTEWCLPAQQPQGCPDDSWSALLGQGLPACS